MPERNIKFEIEDGKIILKGYPEGCEVRQVPFDKRYCRLYSLLLTRYDLNKGKSNLQSLGENEDVNEAILKATIIDFVKCFTSNGQRIQLDKNKVYKSENGADEAYDFYKRLRDKFIAHDESAYATSLVGIVIDPKNKNVVEAIGAGVVIKLDEGYVQTLFNLIEHALKYVEAEIDFEFKRIVEDYRVKDWEEIENLPSLIYEAPQNM